MESLESSVLKGNVCWCGAFGGGAGWLPNLEFYFVPVVLVISLGVGWFLTECVEIPWQFWIRGAHKPDLGFGGGFAAGSCAESAGGV